MKYAIKNPNNCTLENVRKGVELIFGKHAENVRKIGYDISGQICDRALYAYLGIEETIFWNAASAGAIKAGYRKCLSIYPNTEYVRQ